MKRIIIDYRKLSPELAGLLLEAYPQGYGDDDILTFRNPKGEWVEAVELRTPEALYLVKIGRELERILDHFADLDPEAEAETADRYENEYDGSLEADLQFEED